MSATRPRSSPRRSTTASSRATTSPPTSSGPPSPRSGRRLRTSLRNDQAVLDEERERVAERLPRPKQLAEEIRNPPPLTNGPDLAQQLAARNGRRPTAYELRRQPPASGVATRRPRSPSAAASTCRRRLTWCGTSGTTRSGRGGLGRRAQVLDGAGEGSGERSRIGVGLRGPHADPQAARRAPSA